MQHIQNEFQEALQYVCISSPHGSQTTLVLRYIFQIILRRTINKKTYFLKAVAGL